MIGKHVYEPIGVCPLCHMNVVNKGKLYACEREQDCGFKIWKKQYGRVIELEHVQSLLETHTTPLLKFYSKRKGMEYYGFLIWDENEQRIKMKYPK